MPLNRSSAVLLAVLFVSGAGTILLRHKAANAAPAHPRPQRYAAPARTLQAGEVIKDADLELIDWPAEVPLHDAFSGTAPLMGRVALFPIDKGQPILDAYLSAPGSGAGLAGKIPTGMRAIALRSDEIVGVAGFLLPGSRLDVLVTYRSDKAPEPCTATVLQNAEVLAAGHQIQPDPEGKPATVTVVTLLLTPEQAERAVLASAQGSIHFVLRNASDKSQAATPAIQLSQLASSLSPTPAPAPVQHHLMRRMIQVQTISGEQRLTDNFATGEMQ